MSYDNDDNTASALRIKRVGSWWIPMQGSIFVLTHVAFLWPIFAGPVVVSRVATTFLFDDSFSFYCKATHVISAGCSFMSPNKFLLGISFFPPPGCR